MHAKHAKARPDDAREIIENQIATWLHLGRGSRSIGAYRLIPVIRIHIDHIQAGIGAGLQERNRQTLMPFHTRVGQYIGPAKAEGDIGQMQLFGCHDIQDGAGETTLIGAYFRKNTALRQPAEHFNPVGEQLAAFKLRLRDLRCPRRHRLHRKAPKAKHALHGFWQ